LTNLLRVRGPGFLRESAWTGFGGPRVHVVSWSGVRAEFAHRIRLESRAGLGVSLSAHELLCDPRVGCHTGQAPNQGTISGHNFMTSRDCGRDRNSTRAGARRTLTGFWSRQDQVAGGKMLRIRAFPIGPEGQGIEDVPPWHECEDRYRYRYRCRIEGQRV
jgi:hypothetical protein